MDLLRDYIYFYLFIYFFFCIFPLSPDDDGKSRTLCYALFLFFFFYFFAEIFISNSTNSVCKGKKTTPFFYERGGEELSRSGGALADRNISTQTFPPSDYFLREFFV